MKKGYHGSNSLKTERKRPPPLTPCTPQVCTASPDDHKPCAACLRVCAHARMHECLCIYGRAPPPQPPTSRLSPGCHFPCLHMLQRGQRAEELGLASGSTTATLQMLRTQTANNLSRTTVFLEGVAACCLIFVFCVSPAAWPGGWRVCLCYCGVAGYLPGPLFLPGCPPRCWIFCRRSWARNLLEVCLSARNLQCGVSYTA